MNAEDNYTQLTYWSPWQPHWKVISPQIRKVF